MNSDDILAHPARVLEQAQREHYFEHGYLAFPGLLEEVLLDELRAVADKVLDLSRAETESGNRFDLESGHSADTPRLRRATYVDDVDESCWSFCADSVVTDIAADILGPDVRFREAFINFKWAGGGAEVKWHQDIAFYPHTHSGTCQFLVAIEDVGLAQGPLQVIPGSHKGPIYRHYNEAGEWIGAIPDANMAGQTDAVALTGPAGTVSVHHSCAIHGSARNLSAQGRPVYVITYTAADAIPYTTVPYPSSHYGALVRGSEPQYAHHEALRMPLPPDWSGGYTSIFSHQDEA